MMVLFRGKEIKLKVFLDQRELLVTFPLRTVWNHERYKKHENGNQKDGVIESGG